MVPYRDEIYIRINICLHLCGVQISRWLVTFAKVLCVT